MTSPMLLRAAKRVDMCVEMRERAMSLWVESAPGTDDGDNLWKAYEAARADELMALRSFHGMWRAVEETKDADLRTQLERTAEVVAAQRREARR